MLDGKESHHLGIGANWSYEGSENDLTSRH